MKLCDTLEYPIILTGDFNDVPDSTAIAKVRAAGFHSVHGDTEPEFTTSKYREETGLVSRTIDYMFYKNKANRSKTNIEKITGSYFLP